jgi:DNA-binding beta-propeller fold protein YncE
VATALCGDTLFVSDTDNDRIVMLDAGSLAWRGAFGKRGKQPGELTKPAALSVQAHRGELYVVEPTLQRVQVFSLAGLWLRVAVAPGWCKPRGVAAVPGALLVSESEGKRVLAVSQPEGTVLQELALPESVAPYGIGLGEHGRVYVADSRANAVHVLRVKVGA